jgi:hypothetical protein
MSHSSATASLSLECLVLIPQLCHIGAYKKSAPKNSEMQDVVMKGAAENGATPEKQRSRVTLPERSSTNEINRIRVIVTLNDVHGEQIHDKVEFKLYDQQSPSLSQQFEVKLPTESRLERVPAFHLV